MKLKRLFIVLLWACAIGSVSPAFGEGDALRCRFYFPAGSSGMNLYYRNNGTRLEKLMYDIRCRQERSELRRIILRSGASPEGNSFTNKALSDKRLMALRTVICERLFVSDSVFVYLSEGEDWDGLAELVEKSKMPNKDEVLSKIRNTPVCIVWGNADDAQNMEFNHALTAIRFVTGSDVSEGTVKSITLKNVYSTGVYKFENDSWSDLGNAKSYKADINKKTDGTANDTIAAGDTTFMMLPQTLCDTAEIEMVFNNGTNDTTLTASISGQTWAKGTTVTYKLSTTSINWDVEFEVTYGTSGSMENKDTLVLLESGEKQVSVKSYRSKNGTNEGVEWTTKFSVDSCKTWADTVPSWLDGFDTKSSVTTTKFNIRACNWEYVSGGPHHNAMAAKTQKGTASNPYNLANSTGAATIENTANCYIVDAPGYYSFPLVYGNAIKNSVTNEKAYKPGTKTFNSDTANVMATFVNHLNAGITSPYIANNESCVPYKASVIWQEGDSLIGDVKYVDDGNGGKITFSVAKDYICQGNAKIAILNKANTVLWSWHIWVTDDEMKTVETSGFDMLTVDLGWCESAEDEPYEWEQKVCHVKFTTQYGEKTVRVVRPVRKYAPGYGSPFYQWGRKDPFVRGCGCFGEGGTIRHTKDGIHDYTGNHSSQSGYWYVYFGIKNPDVLGVKDHGVWNAWCGLDSVKREYVKEASGSSKCNEISKTIYDPCPVGYTVAPTKAFYYWFGKWVSIRSSISENSVNGEFVKDHWEFYSQGNKSGDQIPFYQQGYRNYSYGTLKNDVTVWWHNCRDLSTGSQSHYIWNYTGTTNEMVNWQGRDGMWVDHVRPVKEP